MSKHRHSTGPGVTFGLWNRIAVIVAGILLVSWGGPAATAFWGSISGGSGVATADAVAQGSKPITAVSGTSVTVTWTASTTAAGRPVTGYSIARYATAAAGTGIAAAGTCTGTIAALSCVDNNVPTGTWYYAVTPLLSAWQGAESTRSAPTAVDATAPGAPALTVPANVNLNNVNAVPVSGTAEANSSVSLTVTDAGGANTSTQTVTANSSGNWTATPLNLSTFNEGTITYSARATDAAGNTGPAGTAASTKDVTAPTVTGVQLNNGGNNPGKVEQGDSVTLSFSEALNPSMICGAWTNSTATQTHSGNNSNQVVVRISAENLLTVTAPGCSTLRIGTVALGAIYTSTVLTFAGNGGNGSSLQWNYSAKTLTITLGAGPTPPSTAPLTTAPATYTPASGLVDTAGNSLTPSPITGTPSRF